MKIGYALTGSFCTIDKSLKALEELAADHEVVPICSLNVAATDTRFFKAKDILKGLEDITGKKPITTIREAEPIGPKKLLDLLVVAPCTGNTLGKLKGGITDTPVTMAVKAHLRNDRPVVLAVSTNDGLSGSGESIGGLLGRRNIYFVPFGQDDYVRKETSLVADFSLIKATAEAAAKGSQLQPVLISPKK